MKKITQYEGLYGQRGVGHARDYLFSELLETRSEFFDWKIKPHVHPDLYQIFFILKGNFEFFGSTASGLYKAPCLVFVPPGALHGFSYQAGTSGRIITWSETLMATLFPDGSPVLTQLSSVQVSTDSSFPFTSGKIAEQLLLLHEELFSDLAEKGEMLKVILKQVIISIYRLCFATIGNEIKAASASYRYYRKYQELVRKADAKYTVKNMAKQIGITPVHLNRICNEITGKPAGRILEESLLEHSKNYLAHTSYSVSEVTYLMGFEYPNYFARFFRKHTGVSPGKFRTNLREGGNLGGSGPATTNS